MGEAMKKALMIFLVVCSLHPMLHADVPSVKVIELKERVAKVLPSLDGWCTLEKALNFIDLVFEVKPKICVEIGVFAGASVFPVASALKVLDQGVIIAIDPWEKVECIKDYDPIEDEADLKWWRKLDMDSIYNSYIYMLKSFNLEKYCVTFKTTAAKAASKIDTIDILYIDGNHSELGSVQDVLFYLPKVKQGGYIWMNDTLWEKRQEAVDLLLAACDVVKLIDNGNCILFKKR